MDINGRPFSPTRELITPIRNKRTRIDRSFIDPHYTDRRFTGENGDAHTIYLAQGLEISSRAYGSETVNDLFYVYSDRLGAHHGFDQMRTAREEAHQKIGNNQSADYFEQVLKNLMNDETIKLGHILSGVNASTGYSYRVFGYSTRL